MRNWGAQGAGSLWRLVRAVGGVSVKVWHFGNDGKFSKINPNSVHL